MYFKTKNLRLSYVLLTAVMLTFISASNLLMAQTSTATMDVKDLTRILETLAADDMRGRASLSKDIEKAADFIASEFKEIGLKPYAEDNYRQTFYVNKLSAGTQSVTINAQKLNDDQFLIIGNQPEINWSEKSAVQVLKISKEEDFSQAFRAIMRTNQGDAVVLVDSSFQPLLARFKKIYSRENILTKEQQAAKSPTKVFLVANEKPTEYAINAVNKTEEFPLFNVAAVLPGKSKPNEYVVFSAHYDHIGILNAVDQDSIANGADDDASGTTAVIALANYYKKLNQNERTLIFVAFTAEEIGMFGSKYFSNKINADEVVAMINIEMIGKDSKFGPNSLYITGYENSNLGKLMQENLTGSSFTFHADPYPQQNLFYRSDNAVLAALGVPAHTFSTSQIDKDSYYHTVKDEVETLDIENIRSSIEAIAIGAKGIVDGTQTPSRVEKLKD
ncbi:peptidase M28 [Sphingobacterium sp. KB22]|uniref:Peptidase M28 n=2 Tax=Sphingobacterium hungaricum TaxID=2082723 RepID=A0A928UU69_9SPHI|nr:peptidase M28 [Sphingobacterium hungaricum]